MKLFELFENKKDDGLFMGVHFQPETTDKLVEFGKSLGIDNIIPKDQFHTTIVYSKKYIPLKPIIHNEVINPKTYSWDLFGEDKNVLVLKFNSDALQERFNKAMELGATYDYDEYKPHVTFSYDINDIDIDSLPLPKFPLKLAEEYQTALDINYKDKL